MNWPRLPSHRGIATFHARLERTAPRLGASTSSVTTGAKTRQRGGLLSLGPLGSSFSFCAQILSQVVFPCFRQQVGRFRRFPLAWESCSLCSVAALFPGKGSLAHRGNNANYQKLEVSR